MFYAAATLERYRHLAQVYGYKIK